VLVKPAEFARRRRQLMRMAGHDAILILPAAAERIRSNDTTIRTGRTATSGI
jgi:Xaa-Pro aminopeptidase